MTRASVTPHGLHSKTQTLQLEFQRSECATTLCLPGSLHVLLPPYSPNSKHYDLCFLRFRKCHVYSGFSPFSDVVSSSWYVFSYLYLLTDIYSSFKPQNSYSVRAVASKRYSWSIIFKMYVFASVVGENISFCNSLISNKVQLFVI